MKLFFIFFISHIKLFLFSLSFSYFALVTFFQIKDNDFSINLPSFSSSLIFISICLLILKSFV